jgi:hypothetical protein
VTVKNLTTGPLHQVHLFGSVNRNAKDELATLTLKDPGEIGAGQTWKQVLLADVPAPSLSTVQWQVVASRAGPSVAATSTTRHRPVLFMLLMMALVVDVSLLAIRSRMRRRVALEALVDSSPREAPLLTDVVPNQAMARTSQSLR